MGREDLIRSNDTKLYYFLDKPPLILYSDGIERLKGNTMERHELSRDAIRGFLVAGNAIITIENSITEKHFTFKIRNPKNDIGKPHFVSLLRGPNNGTDYSFLGTIFGATSDKPIYRHGTKSKVDINAPSAIAFKWFFALLMEGRELPPALHVFHEGRCGRCGHRLTVPESIKTGLGPVCAGRM